MENNKITSFRDLFVWQEAHTFVLLIYKTTSSFPVEEKFGLTNQMRRAAVSITSNIAEGFSRHSPNDKIHFYRISKGSLTEIQNQLILSRDLQYLATSDFDNLLNQSYSVLKLLNTSIQGVKKSYK